MPHFPVWALDAVHHIKVFSATDRPVERFVQGRQILRVNQLHIGLAARVGANFVPAKDAIHLVRQLQSTAPEIKFPMPDLCHALGRLELLKRLRADERTKLLPVVMLTSSDVEQDLLDSFSNGCNSFVRKPVASANFSETVARLGTYWLDISEPLPDRQGNH